MAMVFGMHAALKDKLDDICRARRLAEVEKRKKEKEEADRLEHVRVLLTCRSCAFTDSAFGGVWLFFLRSG